MSNLEYTLLIGQSCDYPHNLFTGAHLVAQMNNSAAAYVDAIREVIMAGGDSGSRSFFVGAMQAARAGSTDAVPAAWTAKAAEYASISQLAAQLVSHRSS